MVRGRGDKVFDALIYFVLFITGLIAVFPIMMVFSMSLTPMTEVIKNGGFVVIPKNITFEAYNLLLQQRTLIDSMGVTVLLAVSGTLLNMILSVLTAYPLSRKSLFGRKVITVIIIFTMYFSGGMIPTYLLVKNIGLINNFWAMIIPSAIGTFNVLVIKSFFENIPEELLESAKIDGAGEFRILLQLVLPLSLPVMMTVGLFYLVGHWNNFFSAIMYIQNPKLYPLQVVLRGILLQNSNSMENVDATIPTVTLQMAAVVFACVPIIAVYPFIQKYFTKGMMLGAVKG